MYRIMARLFGLLPLSPAIEVAPVTAHTKNPTILCKSFHTKNPKSLVSLKLVYQTFFVCQAEDR